MKKDKNNHAFWIWYGDPGYDIVNSYLYARRTFTLTALPRSAPVMVTADSRYRLFVNGEYVCRGPARGYQHSWPVDRIDIAPYLRRGENVVAAIVHNFGIGTFQYVHQGYAGFLLEGSVGGVSISTDNQWRTKKAPGFLRHTTRASLQMGFQEQFDARIDTDDWLKPGYTDNDWPHPGSCRIKGAMPWHSFEERGIPLLNESFCVTPKRIIAQAAGICHSGYRESTDVVTAYTSDLKNKNNWQLTPQILTLSQSGAQLSIEPTTADGYRAVCIDFEREVVGSIQLEVCGARGGEIIDSIVAERVFENGAPDGHISFGNRLILRQDTTRHEQFDMWGFRYLCLIVRDSTTPLTITVQVRGALYPLEIKGAFKSSDSLLNQIYEMSKHTQQCCMLDAYVDCPMREQAQWWGDARVQSLNTFYLSADARLLARGIRQIAAQEVPNGLTYGHAPTISHNCILPDFTLTWIMTLHDYWWQTGDLSLFKEQRERVKRALAYFDEVSTKNGLLPYDNRYWLFLDWCPVFKEGYPTIYNLYYVKALRVAAELFSRTGDRTAAALYTRREKKLVAAIKKLLYSSRDNTFYGGLDWDNRPVKQDAPHNYTYAILLDLFPDHKQQWINQHLLPLCKGNHDTAVTPSVFWMFYVFEALKLNNGAADVIDCIRRWWGEFVAKGFAATPESIECNNSMCHAWSAHPLVQFSNILLGVWQESAQWKKVRIAPLFIIDDAQGSVATPHGTITVAWKKEGERCSMQVSLPKKITGTLYIPGIKRRTFTGNITVAVPVSSDTGAPSRRVSA